MDHPKKVPLPRRRYFKPDKRARTQSYSSISAIAEKLGVFETYILSSTFNHVPVQFPDRNKYVSKIFNALTGKMLLPQDLHVFSALLDVDNSNQLSKEQLWQASQSTGEPLMKFVLPDCDECLKCAGQLHSVSAFVTSDSLHIGWTNTCP
jgi:hypothetical protein